MSQLKIDGLTPEGLLEYIDDPIRAAVKRGSAERCLVAEYVREELGVKQIEVLSKEIASPGRGFALMPEWLQRVIAVFDERGVAGARALLLQMIADGEEGD